MVNIILLYVGAGLTVVWGITHLFPTRNIVRGFGELSDDNRRILTMEWIVEGVAIIFIGALVTVVTAIEPAGPAAQAVFIVSALGLLVLAVVSLLTGFRIRFLPFRLCPVIFTSSAVLILWGGLM